MPVQTKWYDDKHTMMHFTMTDPWEWDDFYEAIASIHSQQLIVEHSVVWLFDMRQSKTLPKDILNQTKLMAKKRPPNTYPTYLILGGNMLMRSLANLFMRLFSDIYGTYIHFVATPEEAEAMALTISVTGQKAQT